MATAPTKRPPCCFAKPSAPPAIPICTPNRFAKTAFAHGSRRNYISPADAARFPQVDPAAVAAEQPEHRALHKLPPVAAVAEERDEADVVQGEHPAQW